MPRRLIVPAALTASMLAVLIGLGVWQVHRLRWKEGVLAAIDRAETAAPEPLDAVPGGVPTPFQKLLVRGTWGEGTALFRSSVRITGGRERLGADLIQPIDRPDGPPVLIDRGWVPEDEHAPASGPAEIVGFARLPERPSWASVADDLARRHFFSLDPAAIGQSLGLAEVAPFTVVALGDDTGGLPVPAAHLPRPPNNHLQYTLTWFGLAAVLLVMFIVYARRRPDDRL